MNRVKAIAATAPLLLALILVACSNDDIAASLDGEFVTVSGTVTRSDELALADATVEAVYSSPGGALNPAVATDNNGGFAIQVLKDTAFYFHVSKTAYATVNTARSTMGADSTVADLAVATENEAQFVIDAAFAATLPVLINHAWLMIDAVDSNGVELNGVTVSSVPGPVAFVYTECDGSDSGETMTTGAPCSADREGPMYIAYFDSPGEVAVTINGQQRLAPVRMGELTYVAFVL